MPSSLLILFLVVEPPAAVSVANPGDEPRDTSTEEAASGFVEDMPDPYSADWEPPVGPAKPPPAPPPPSVGAAASGAASELPPGNGVPTGPPEAARHGQRLQAAGLVFGVGGGIGLAVGVYLFDELSKTKAALASEQALVDLGVGSPGRIDELETQVEKQRQGTVISLVAGGSALGLGVILLSSGIAVKNRAAKAATTWLAPGPGLVGLAVRRRF